MKLLSKTCVYGIRAALLVASIGEREKYVPIRRLSDELGISFYFLTKILQTLTQARIMVSYRGPNGGVALARPANEISLMEMINVIETEKDFETCVLGLEKCGEDKPCPFHEEWKETRNRIIAMFADTNLAELSRKINQEGYRLAM